MTPARRQPSRLRGEEAYVIASDCLSPEARSAGWREGNEEGENYTYAIALLNTDSDG